MDIKLALEANRREIPHLKICKSNKDSSSSSLPCFKSPRSPPPRETDEAKNVKCVIIGDPNVGKTSLVTKFLFEEFTSYYMPTTRDDYTYCTTTNLILPGGNNKDENHALISTSHVKVDVDLDISDTGGEVILTKYLINYLELDCYILYSI